ncbi:MAG TPA: PAS domain S-box protein, partial [Deltaproteobacteria bacterium]|nr:PAS domain S-box protein [Deltaproteobacteria bacterium]
PGDSARYIELVQARGRVDRFDTRFRKKDGTLRDVVVSGSILEVGDQRHLLTIVHDVTEQKRSAELLQLSEQKFSLAFQSSPDAISISELGTGRIIDINRAYERRTGYSREELIDHTTTELGIWAHPEERERFMDALRRDRALNLFEAALRTKAGQLRDMLLSATVIAIGGTEYILSMARDITKRKSMERALRESEERYRKITAAITDYIYTVYLEEGNVTRTVHSAACEAVTGYTAEDFEKDPYLWFSMVEEEDREMVREHFNRVTAGERVDPIEHRIRRKDGTVRWVSNMPVIHRDETGAMDSYDGVVSDITGRKEAERAIRERQARLDSIFRVAPTGIGVVVDRVLVEVNDRICEMTGYARGELVGRSARVLYPSQEDYDFVGAEKYRQIGEKGTGTVETRWLRKDGSAIDIILSSTPIDPQNHSAGVTFTALDITERKRAEEALRASEAKIRGITTNIPGAVYQFYARPGGEMGLYFVSKRVEELLCIDSTPDDFFERFTERVAPEDRERFLASIKEAVSTQSPWECEVRYIKPDGEELYVRGVSHPERHDGELVFNGVLLDVTDRRKAENALRESEERYRLMAELTGKLVYDCHIPSGRITWHGAVSQVTGLVPERFGGTDMKTWISMIHPEDREKTAAILDAARAECGLYQAEYRVRRKDREYIYVEDHGVFVADEEGRAYRMLGSIGDITQRKNAEELLREKTEELNRFFDVAVDLLCIAGMDGRFRLLNRAWEGLLGYSREELMAGRFFDFIHPDDVKGTEDVVARLASGHEVVNFVNRYLRSDGSYCWLEWRAAPVEDTIYAAARDITERRQAEEALRESEERYHSLFDNSHAVMLLIDPETGDIVDANPAACTYYGATRQELTARKITDINTLSRDEVFAEMEKARWQGRRSFVFRHRLCSGEIRDVEVFSGPITVAGRTLLYSIVHDITERKRAEDALRESEDRFRTLIQSSSDIIVILDKDGRISYETPSFSRILGFPPGALLGRSPLENIHPDDVPRV